MKKLFYLMILSILIIPISVKADMGAPAIKTYKATPVSKEGATLYSGIYEENPEAVGKIEYNEVVTVTSETKINGKVYADACNKKEVCGSVLLSDLKLSSKTNDLSEYNLKYVGRIFSDKAIEIYEYPGYIYKKLGKSIPSGTVFLASNYDSVGTWIKVSYDGVTGYIDTDDEAAMLLYNGEAIVGNEVYKEFYLSNPFGRSIAYNESGKYNIASYNYECSVWHNKTDEFELVKDIGLSDNYLSEKKSSTLKGGAKVKIIYDCSYQGVAAFYVESNGAKGWISYTEWDDDKSEIKYDVYLKGFDTDKLSKDSTENVENSLVLYSEYSDDDVTITDPKTGDVITPDNKGDKKDDDKKTLFAGFTKDQIILISSIGAGVIVLTAIVTIILVNKKKNKKENSVQE